MTTNLAIWSVPAVSDRWTLPDSYPQGVLNLSARACRRQYVPLSFCVQAKVACRVSVAVGSAPDGPVADLRYVRCWIQNRDIDYGDRDPGLVPELLIHDPNLVTVKSGKNVVRQPVVDADELLPMDFPAKWTQQYYMLVHVPKDCDAGRHSLDVVVTCGDEVHHLPISIGVLPFTLAESGLKFGVYYKGVLKQTPADSPNSGSGQTEIYRTADEYANDLDTMVQQGITCPILWEDLVVPFLPGHTTDSLEQVLEMRELAGCCNDPIVAARTSLGYYSEADIPAMQVQFRKIMDVLTRHGIKTLIALGQDDSYPANLQRQLPVWRAAREIPGVQVGCACMGNSASTLSIVGKSLDLAMFNSTSVNPAPWHKQGSRVWLYGPTTPEWPESWYRRRYGFLAVREGFDGCCPYVWQETWGESPYDDLDSKYKDHMLVYPGDIETLQLEGFREAVYDARYATTLKRLGGTMPPDRGRNLDDVRSETIDKILTLQ